MNFRASLAILATFGLVLSGSAVSASAAQAVAGEVWTADKVLASDDFNRADQPGWGAATQGGSYQLNGTPSFSIAAKRGVIELPTAGTSRMANISSVSAVDATMTASFSVPVLPSGGGGVRIALYERQSGSKAYRCAVTISPTGEVSLVMGRIDDNSGRVATLVSTPTNVSAAEGTSLSVEFRATGQNPVTLSSRVWKTGGTKSDWQSIATDTSAQRVIAAGVPGVWAYTSTNSSAATVSFEKIGVQALVSSIAPAPVPAPVPVPVPPAPAPPVPPAPPAPPAPPVPPAPADGGQVNGAGAPKIGSTAYPVPSGALFVAPSGSDRNAGTKELPVKTIAKAISLAPNGKTIVLRAGTYHETLVVPGSKSLTIQNYPSEAAWLDGSSLVSGFVKVGSVWVASGWTTTFDHSPTYTRGAPDNTQAGWSFINPAFPMAAHPDQVWVNDKELSQVASKATVVKGTFFVDEKAHQLVVGTDPVGGNVAASTLVRALTLQSPNSLIQGIGIRRFAPSIPDMGAVRLDNTATGSSVRDVSITDMATTGLSIAAKNVTVTSVTASDNGFLGVHSVYADGLIVSKMLIENNNTEEFNHAPAAGGIKITRARNVSVDASVVRGNKGNGVWFDESVYHLSVTNSTVTGNGHHGISAELSEKIVIANNYVADNADAGIKLFSSGGAQIINNTTVRNWMNIYVVQDKRRNSNVKDAGHDPRQVLPDPTVPWYVENISVLNNVIGAARPGTGCVLCVQDSTKMRTGTQMRMTIKGNLFQRAAATGASKGLITWPNSSAGAVSYLSLTAFMAATKQGDPGVDYVGAVDKSGASPAATIAQAAAKTAAIPTAIAVKTGLKAGAVGANHQ